MAVTQKTTFPHGPRIGPALLYIDDLDTIYSMLRKAASTNDGPTGTQCSYPIAMREPRVHCGKGQLASVQDIGRNRNLVDENLVIESFFPRIEVNFRPDLGFAYVYCYEDSDLAKATVDDLFRFLSSRSAWWKLPGVHRSLWILVAFSVALSAVSGLLGANPELSLFGALVATVFAMISILVVPVAGAVRIVPKHRSGAPDKQVTQNVASAARHPGPAILYLDDLEEIVSELKAAERRSVKSDSHATSRSRGVEISTNEEEFDSISDILSSRRRLARLSIVSHSIPIRVELSAMSATVEGKIGPDGTPNSCPSSIIKATVHQIDTIIRSASAWRLLPLVHGKAWSIIVVAATIACLDALGLVGTGLASWAAFIAVATMVASYATALGLGAARLSPRRVHEARHVGAQIRLQIGIATVLAILSTLGALLLEGRL